MTGMVGQNPELLQKPLALILPSDEDMALWETLTTRQRGYALHWMRSNRLDEVSMRRIVKKAKAQRPSITEALEE